jgi:PPOX class probable FMN-dependent enzyme
MDITYPSWRQTLARSLHLQRSKLESKFFQVANIDEEGRVQNRTMVFRGFVDGTHQLLAITDTRSQKYEQWRRDPNAQLCWYFTKTREQFRISSHVSLLSDNNSNNNEESGHQDIDKKTRMRVWSMLSDNAKEQFYWPAPKTDIEQGQNQSQSQSQSQSPTNKDTNTSSITSCHQYFAVVVFTPFEVDYLNLKTKPQTRELHVVDALGVWTNKSVNP